jgi:uncharacterized OsmC-like protein
MIGVMDRVELRALQAPVRERYQADPESAWTPIRGEGRWSGPGITTSVDTWSGPVRAGLHPATGGDGSDACSGDMLMQALVGCAGVTMRSVATAMGLELGAVEVVAESHFDARGTLGVDRSVDVGIGQVTLTATVDADLDDTARQRLATSTERYCVVGQSLRQVPTVVVVTREA